MTNAGDFIFYGLSALDEPCLEDFLDESLSYFTTLMLVWLLTLVLLRMLILSSSTSMAEAFSGMSSYDSPLLSDILETLRDIDFDDTFFKGTAFTRASRVSGGDGYVSICFGSSCTTSLFIDGSTSSISSVGLRSCLSLLAMSSASSFFELESLETRGDFFLTDDSFLEILR